MVKKHFLPSHGRGMPEGQGVGRRRKRAKPTSGATRHLFPEEGGRRGESHLPPSCGRGMPEGQGVGRRRKRVKLTSGAARHLLPEEGGRIGESYLPPFPVGGRSGRSQPPALCATSFQRKEGEEVRNHLPPSQGRGMPGGQGVGRRQSALVNKNWTRN